MTCSYKHCKKSLPKGDGRVEVKTILPKGGLQDSKKFLILWDRNGEAMFHTECWSSLSKAGRARRKHTDLPDLSTEEKILVKEAAKTAEYFDSLTRLKDEALRVANILKKAKSCVAFTGAGISTSAGIGDYRGKSGKWTEMDHDAVNVDSLFEEGTSAGTTNEEPPAKKRKTESNEEENDDDGVPYESLRPTYTHEALQKLMEIGYLKHIISQNGDGLHKLSGIPEGNLSELHGNVFVEKCEKCQTRYERDFYVMDDHCSQYFEELEDFGETDIIKPKHAKQCDKCKLSHRTGRKCDKKGCNGALIDTIINFCDHLEESILEQAEEKSEQCDLMICLGSTLTVTPACDLVEMIKSPQRIVICNRQKTQKDNQCLQKDAKGETLGSRVFGDCDVFMKELMKNLSSPKCLKEWEDGREERMKLYNLKRQTVN